MNRFFSLGLLYLSLGATCISAATSDDANRQYRSGDFVEAAAAYERLLTSDGPRSSIFYNLGNSFLNLKQYGSAILAYERASLLTPRDPDLLTNLALARKAAASTEQVSANPNLEAVLKYLSRDEWSWLVAGSALFLGVSVLLCGSVRLPKRVFHSLISVTAAAGFLIVLGLSALYLRRSEEGRGIVLSGTTAVRLSPFEKAESLGTPGLGKLVRLGVKNGDFQYVMVSGANLQGWLASKDVAAIVPE
jgi:tetratricopeptide (TPR) repeat protein